MQDLQPGRPVGVLELRRRRAYLAVQVGLERVAGAYALARGELAVQAVLAITALRVRRQRGGGRRGLAFGQGAFDSRHGGRGDVPPAGARSGGRRACSIQAASAGGGSAGGRGQPGTRARCGGRRRLGGRVRAADEHSLGADNGLLFEVDVHGGGKKNVVVAAVGEGETDAMQRAGIIRQAEARGQAAAEGDVEQENMKEGWTARDYAHQSRAIATRGDKTTRLPQLGPAMQPYESTTPVLRASAGPWICRAVLLGARKEASQPQPPGRLLPVVRACARPRRRCRAALASRRPGASATSVCPVHHSAPCVYLIPTLHLDDVASTSLFNDSMRRPAAVDA